MNYVSLGQTLAQYASAAWHALTGTAPGAGSHPTRGRTEDRSSRASSASSSKGGQPGAGAATDTATGGVKGKGSRLDPFSMTDPQLQAQPKPWLQAWQREATLRQHPATPQTAASQSEGGSWSMRSSRGGRALQQQGGSSSSGSSNDMTTTTLETLSLTALLSNLLGSGSNSGSSSGGCVGAHVCVGCGTVACGTWAPSAVTGFVDVQHLCP